VPVDDAQLARKARRSDKMIDGRKEREGEQDKK
jgi:hypothetical protein